jgi:integrase
MKPRQYEINLVDKYINDSKKEDCPKNQRFIAGFVEHRLKGKPVNNHRKKTINEKTGYKFIVWLEHISKWMKKDFDKLTEEDVDDFRQRLKRDTIHKRDHKIKDKKTNKIQITKGEPFKDSVKRDLEYKILRPFLQYLGKGDLVNFYDEYNKIEELDTVNREKIEEIAKTLTLKHRAILLTLFDSGFRPGEFLSLTYKNVLDEGGDTIKVRCVESKTKTRTVSVPIATESIRAWIQSNKDLKGTNNPLFDIQYTGLTKFLHRIGKKHLKRPITSRTLRHSSATFYCHQYSPYQLCKRYGWSMSSRMPEVYINREGLNEEESVETIVAVDMQ